MKIVLQHGIVRKSLSASRKCSTYFVHARRPSSSLQSRQPEKPYYVTTPIFYVNAAPHIGHLYSLILTDVFKRWATLRGKKAILCTGTDEHGIKIQRTALKAREDVQTFCEKNSRSFDELAKSADIDRDHFIRTSQADHRFAVQHFWMMLKERGHIYMSKHEGWYSINDEAFYPASAVQLALDPSTGRKFTASIETGQEVEWIAEENYHFRLSGLKDRLLEFYSKNPNLVIPSTRMREVVTEVESGLGDLSISRPAERLSWGIPVPDDETQTIYVWLDALISYLTKANYPFQVPGEEETAGWPADLHVIGKDIVRFHAIYWPAFLLALDLPLPRQILAHAHWTLGRHKMSKSRGNVVNPFFALERFGVDTMRFFLTLQGGIKDDAVYDNALIIERYKSSLKESLGNLLSRVMRGKGWNVRRAVELHQFPKGVHSTQLAQSLEKLPFTVSKLIEEELDPGSALQLIVKTIKNTNAYMQDDSPWTYSKHTSSNYTNVDRIIYLCAESLRISGILLQPFMPSKMKQLLDSLGVADTARGFKNATSVDLDYGTPTIELGKGMKGVLFPPLSSDF